MPIMASKRHQLQELAQFFRILGDPIRLRIVEELSGEELNVTQLGRKLRVSQPTVSRNLGILRLAGLVQSRRDGKEVFYTVTPSKRRGLKAVVDRGVSLAR